MFASTKFQTIVRWFGLLISKELHIIDGLVGSNNEHLQVIKCFFRLPGKALYPFKKFCCNNSNLFHTRGL
jgi:hypothetical protein